MSQELDTRENRPAIAASLGWLLLGQWKWARAGLLASEKRVETIFGRKLAGIRAQSTAMLARDKLW